MEPHSTGKHSLFSSFCPSTLESSISYVDGSFITGIVSLSLSITLLIVHHIHGVLFNLLLIS